MGMNEMQRLTRLSGSIQDTGLQKSTQNVNVAQGLVFGELLKAQTQTAKKSQELNFSKHAAKRMDERGISVDRQLLGDLTQAVEGARQKGAKDLAVIGRQGVFIVNVPNNVVVTTMSADDMKDRVFTNIDSAVIL